MNHRSLLSLSRFVSVLTLAGTGVVACGGSRSESQRTTESAASQGLSGAASTLTGIDGACVDVIGGNTADTAYVGIWSCNGTPWQQWSQQGDTIVGWDGKCLDARWGGTANGTAVQMYDCNGTGAQVWQARGGELVNPESGRCLDATGNTSTNGTALELWDCWNGPNQQWSFTAATGDAGGGTTPVDAGGGSSDASGDGAGPAAAGLVYGTNLHANADYGSGSAAAIGTQFDLMAARHLTAARVGGVPLPSSDGPTQAWIDAAEARGTHLSFMLDIAWIVCPSDARTFASNDATTIYNQTYQAVLAFVSQYAGSITDWEMGNEIDLTAGQSSGPGQWNAGWTSADWKNVAAYGSPDYFGNWAAAVRAASDAIAKVSATSAKPLRRILNVTGTHTGFLDFMAASGVSYDVISYHYYYSDGVSPYALAASAPGSDKDTWDVLAALGAYARPVTINEINCAEIYQPGYDDTAGSALYATCLHNLRDQIGYLRAQNEMNLESLYVYELLDEPQQGVPENHFGLLWNDGNGGYTPKANLLLWSAFAGGALTSAETATLDGLGLLPLP